MKARFRRFLLHVLIILFSTTIGLVFCEVALRYIDGFYLSSFKLISSRPSVAPRDPQLDERGHAAVQRIATAEGVDREWFDDSPPPLPNRQEPDPVLLQRYRTHSHPLESIYIWNRKHVAAELCRTGSFFDLEDAYVFDTPSGSRFPRYHFPAGKTLPTGLVTNEFGWRGPSLSLNRPPKTIRIAFIGASTTVNGHGYPFSYPEYVIHWLNRWAKARGLDIQFEVINTGHEGTNSNDFRAIAEDELVRVDPDFEVYYEGSNQFWPVSYVEWPGGVVAKRLDVTFAQTFLTTHSAIVRRISYGFKNGQDGREPRKVFGKVRWPATVNEFNPDPANPDLPLNLPTILQDLRAIHSAVHGAGSNLVVSSFVWLPFDGMVLELPRQKTIYDYLNDTFGPFPYSHMRRMADFQNRTFKNFAAADGDLFIDVSGQYPQDPNFFDDAIHMNPTGIRLHAWIVFQQLIPLLQERISSGMLPRPVQVATTDRRPPQTSVELVRIEDLKRGCGAVSSQKP